MSELPLHRHYLHYTELPYSQRVLYTAALLVLGKIERLLTHHNALRKGLGLAPIDMQDVRRA